MSYITIQFWLFISVYRNVFKLNREDHLKLIKTYKTVDSTFKTINITKKNEDFFRNCLSYKDFVLDHPIPMCNKGRINLLLENWKFYSNTSPMKNFVNHPTHSNVTICVITTYPPINIFITLHQHVFPLSILVI